MTEFGPGLQPSVELRMRFASGAVLIAAVVVAVLGGTQLFAMLIALGAIAALREWHRLVNGGRLAWETFPSVLGVVVMVGLVHAHAPIGWSVAAILLGAAGAATVSMARRNSVLWHGVGAVYLGIPSLSLVALRGDEFHGVAFVGGVFAAVWAADTGALFLGRLIGGPRLAPILSPNKTWAGLVGGVLMAGLAEAAYVGALGGAVAQGLLLGLFLGIAANCGDLFESWVKRVFHTKNSGNLIPGHGGMLDRIDSLLFAAPAAAGLLLIGGNNPFLGTGP